MPETNTLQPWPHTYLFRLKNGHGDVLELASKAHALRHAELNRQRYTSVWDGAGQCIWKNRGPEEPTT